MASTWISVKFNLNSCFPCFPSNQKTIWKPFFNQRLILNNFGFFRERVSSPIQLHCNLSKSPTLQCTPCFTIRGYVTKKELLQKNKERKKKTTDPKLRLCKKSCPLFSNPPMPSPLAAENETNPKPSNTRQENGKHLAKGGDLNGIDPQLIIRWLHYPIPTKALSIMTKDLSPLYSLIPSIMLDSLTGTAITTLQICAKSNIPIAIFYAVPTPLSSTPPIPPSLSQIPLPSSSLPESSPHSDQLPLIDPDPLYLVGNLCIISALIRHPQKIELQGRVVRRIITTYDPKSIWSLQPLPISPFLYQPGLNQADLEDCYCATLTQLSMVDLPFVQFLQSINPFAKSDLMADFALNRLASILLNEIKTTDPGGSLNLIQDAFFKTNLIEKADSLHRAQHQASIALDLSLAVENMNHQRKLRQMDVSMEKILKLSLPLAEFESSIESRLLNQILLLPQLPKSIAMRELEYLKTMDPNGADYAHTITYLECLASLPWFRMTKDNFDVFRAKKILSQYHYGLDEVKDKILQLVANASRTGIINGQSLLLVGPPGTGKTTMAKAIAKAIGRHYIHLAGLTESSDLRGFRRTYVGAMPGKVMSEIRRLQSSNPVIVFDEVDKIDDRRTHKPITPVLLELLSPDQNKSFFDQYLDVPFDLSQSLFICTANTTDTIPLPLLNRMQVIEMRAYSEYEKKVIAEKYLIPVVQKETGLPKVNLSSMTVKNLIKEYAREEAGVRELKRRIQTIYRKIAMEAIERPIEERKGYERQVESEEMIKLLGTPEPNSQFLYPYFPPGVVIALAKNQYGGSILIIEAVVIQGQERKEGELDRVEGNPKWIQFTGNVMTTMQESSQIAYSFAKLFLSKISLIPIGSLSQNLNPIIVQPLTILDYCSIHVNVAHGAVRKDGPSAGCALTTAFVSLALNLPIREGCCMTGEITLSGQISAVGGIREKVLAACQANLSQIILPEQNRVDFEAIPEIYSTMIRPVYVTHFSQVVDYVFPHRVQLRVD